MLGQPEGLLYRLPDSSDWRPASQGLELPAGTSLWSGGTRPAIVGYAANSVTIQAGSELTLPQPGTEIVAQPRGMIRYQIRPGSTHNFGVETPYLVIGIKGTIFDVLVSSTGAETRVIEGRVAASTPDDRFSVELTPGQTARIAAATGSVLEVQRAPEGAFVPASQQSAEGGQGRALVAPLDAQDSVRSAMAAGYQGDPSVAVTDSAEGVFDRLRAAIGELLSDVQVIADERLHPAPRTVVKATPSLSGEAGGSTGGGGGTGGGGSASGTGGGGSGSGTGSGGTGGGGSASGGSGGGDLGGGLGGSLGDAVGGLRDHLGL